MMKPVAFSFWQIDFPNHKSRKFMIDIKRIEEIINFFGKDFRVVFQRFRDKQILITNLYYIRSGWSEALKQPDFTRVKWVRSPLVVLLNKIPEPFGVL